MTGLTPLLLALGLTVAPDGKCPSFEDLAARFWAFRARTQPYSADDIPRIERPPGLVRSWSRASVDSQRAELVDLEACLRSSTEGEATWPVARRVDVRLLRSATARVHWELEVNRRWQRDPAFYVEQTLTPVVELLVEPPPIDAARGRELVSRLRNIPALLEEAKANLTDGVPLFAQLAAGSLEHLPERLQRFETQLVPVLPEGPLRREVSAAVRPAADALESYRAWLLKAGPRMKGQASLGRGAYVFFLRRVALMPYTPEQLLAMAQQDWERSVAAEAVERQRNEALPQLPYFKTLDEQIARTRKDEAAVRRFLDARGILTVQDGVHHYTVRPVPAYLDALEGFGEEDWFPGPSKLGQDGVRWLSPPSPKAGFFGRIAARDARPLITHEGVPGHDFQLALSWGHPDPIRRHYYDSGANEGIGFYAEEMLMQAGLYDESPRSRELIWEMSRLRSARVIVDVKLALGEMTLAEAEQFLVERAPMDAKSAHPEAAFFSVSPGQAMTYTIGKLQILKLLAETRFRQRDGFSLRRFHDGLWLNGNVPLSLQRWELLGAEDEIRMLDAEAGAPLPQ